MAIVRAVKSGNWSDTTVWNTGALPTSADDVYSNTFTVTIDVSPTVLSISNASATGVTAGGGFQITANNITLTCTGTGISAGGTTTTCLIINLTVGQTCNVIGNVTGGTFANGSSWGMSIPNSGTVNITGTVRSGDTSVTHGVNSSSSSSATINITGNVQAGNGANTYGVLIGFNSIATITGQCTAAANPANTNNFAAYASNNSIITITGSLQSSNAVGTIAQNSMTSAFILSGPFLTSSNGTNPIWAWRWFWANSNVTPTYYQIRTANLATIRPLYTADSVGGNPAASNVRSGTVYGPAGELTGTCAVPGASSVLSGVPVDNTTGTATISAASIRSAVGLASANLDTQLAAIPTTAAPTAAAIRTELDTNSTKLANLDATVSSRSTYAGGDTSGTTTLLSRLTSGRAGNLDNLDATVSSRLAGSSYSAPLDAAGTRNAVGLATGNLDTQLSGLSSGISGLPSASAIASAVWAAATRTLTTAIDNSSTIAAAVWSYATGRTITGGTVDTLTNAPSVPSAAAIASQVRTELSTELSRLDTTVSSRLAPAGTLARVTLVDTTTTLTNAPDVPTEAEIADAVRTELAPELAHLDADISSRQATLARLQNCATTQEVGDIVEEAMQP